MIWALVLAYGAGSPRPADATLQVTRAPPPPPAADSMPAWTKGFGYGVALSFDQARDELLAPLRWRGPGVGLKGSWTWGGPATRHAVALKVPLTVLDNRFGHQGYALAPALTYGYLRRVAEPGPKAGVWAGGRARLDMFNGFYESWDDEHLYWFTAYSLGPSVSFRGDLQGTPAWAALDVPLLAAVARPPRERLNQIDRLTKLSGHVVDTGRNPALATIPDYASLHATVGVVVTVWGASVSLSYDLDWSTYASPSRVSVLSQSITIARRPPA